MSSEPQSSVIRARDAYIAQCADKPSLQPYANSLRELPEEVSEIQEGVISKITLFIGKALGGLEVDAARVTDEGLETLNGFKDRAFMLARREKPGAKAAYKRFSQREEAKLALVKPALDGDVLSFSAPGMDTLLLTKNDVSPRDGNTTSVETSGGDILNDVVVEDGVITEAIRQFLMQRCGYSQQEADDIVVLFPSLAFDRPVEARHNAGEAGETVLSDGGQITIASVSSHEFYAKEARRRNVYIAPMSSFRANIEVEGLPANAEDILQEMRVVSVQEDVREDVTLLAGDLCIRCAVTMVNQKTGEKAKREPLKTLGEIRPKRLSNDPTNVIPTFMVNVIAKEDDWGKIIRKGDKVVPVSEKEV